MNFIGSNTSYILDFDNVDINFGLERNLPEATITLWKANSFNEKTYYEFEIVASKENEVTGADDNSTYVTYKCPTCDIDVPRVFMKQHNQSEKHRVYLEIIDIALERAKQSIRLNIDNENSKSERGVYFCDACATAVKLQDRNEHDISRAHFKSQMHDRFLRDFLKIYTDKEYIEELQFVYTKTDIIDVDDGSDSDYDLTSDATARSDAEDASGSLKLSLEEYVSMLNERIDGANRLTVEGGMIKITTLDKSVVKVPEENFHSFYAVNGLTICGTCQYVISDMDGDMDYHKMSSDHIERICEPLQDIHCIRAGHASNYCVLCKMMVNISLDAHKRTQLHIDSLNKARVTDAVVQSNKAPTSDTTVDGASDDVSIGSASCSSSDGNPWNTVVNNNNKTTTAPRKIRGKTYCPPCKVYIDTHNYSAHAKGKIHRANVEAENSVANSKTAKTLCKPCDRYIDANNFDSHTRGKTHRANVELAKKKPAVNANVGAAKTFCPPCNFYVDSHNYHSHANGRAHRDNVEIANRKKVAVTDVEPGKTYCEPCDVYIHTHNFHGHTQGARHESNLKNTAGPALMNPQGAPLHEHMVRTGLPYVLSCVVCSVNVPIGALNVNEHVLGRTHEANLNTFISELHPHLEFSNGTVHCVVCGTRVKLSAANAHANSNSHQSQYRYLLDSNKMDRVNGSAFCFVCLSDIELHEEFDHLCSEDHKQRLDQRGSAQNYCSICEVELPGGPHSFAIHVNGRPHRSKFSKAAQDCIDDLCKELEDLKTPPHIVNARCSIWQQWINEM